jgi:O-acetylhomoserine/O-acetylserine sulfhydrylase-like pyridoxal-dependent enzyme
MSAIATLFLSMVKPGDTIVHSGPLYAATETLIARILGRFGVHWLDFPAGATREEIDAVLGKACVGQCRADLSRIPANPTNALVDVEAVRASRDAIFKGAKPPIAIDNTFLGPLWAQPLKQGADIVVYSLTKYAGGHSDLVAGGVLGSKEHINTIRLMRNTIGTICDPNTAWMLLRSLETLELRMSRAGENAVKVCEFLRHHPKVEHVGYLGFLEEGSRQADIYNRHCTGAGSTFSLYLKGGEKEAFAFLDSLKIAKLAVSLGGTETLASHPAGDDPFVGARCPQAGARDHRQSGPHLDRGRGCRRPDRRFRGGAEGGLTLLPVTRRKPGTEVSQWCRSRPWVRAFAGTTIMALRTTGSSRSAIVRWSLRDGCQWHPVISSCGASPSPVSLPVASATAATSA